MLNKEISETTRNLTVYYDGSCPLCTREIFFYRRLIKDEAIFFDVSNCNGNPCEDLDINKAMQRFHVRSKQGELVSGAGAFALILLEITGLRWLGMFLTLKPIRIIADYIYILFLVIRPTLQALMRLWNKRK